MSDGMEPVDVHDCGGDAAAYVLGALEPAEVDAFRTHLEQCSVCRDEVDAMQGVVQALPMAAPQYPASSRLRRRITRGVRQDLARSRRVRLPNWTTRFSAGEWLGGLGVACTTALVLIALLSSSARPPVHVIHAQVTGARGTAQIDVSQGAGVLVVHHLTPPPRGRVFEVWLKAPGHPPVAANVLFSVSRQGDAEVGLPGSLRGMSLMMVTTERAGGSPVPTSRPVIVARLA